MRSILKSLLKYYLKAITKLVLLIKRPTIIGVAGNTNKTFTKNKIVEELERNGKNVRANPNNFNTEIGLPLAILYLPSGYNYYQKWVPTILKAPFVIFQRHFPDFLVLELGTSDAGDMKYLLTLVTPKISIITDITQKYLEGYNDMEEMVKEYELLVKKTPKKGMVVLNYDNPEVRKLEKYAHSTVVSFGYHKNSDLRIIHSDRGEKGEVVKINRPEAGEETYQLDRFGDHHIRAFLVALIIKQKMVYEGEI